MDFTERLEMYQEGGMLDRNDVKDVLAIIDLFKNEYNVVLQEENADTFIAHICAAYFRNKTGEPVDELPEAVMSELLSLDTYEESTQILSRLIEVTHNSLNQVEQNYALLHINNLISKFKESNEWTHKL